jgi:TPP-dependent pyruvate/acetoin dehydrogenase alpha subunit
MKSPTQKIPSVDAATREITFGQAINEVATEIKDAVNFALNAPYPPAEEVDQHVYA